MPESPARIEPVILANLPGRVADLIADLSAKSSTLGSRLAPPTADHLAGHVRIMNAYYSNLIEGHNTQPRDIERAMRDDLDQNRERRNLQLEAAAHVRVQAAIDALAAKGTLPEPASAKFIKWLHLEFYRDAPEEMLRIEGPGGAFTMEPGQWRKGPEQNIAVGRHEPPSSDYVDAFMDRFSQAYRSETMGTSTRIQAIAAAHHRFNYIHPFPDGNGRVSRLMSHAMAHRAGIAAYGLWSVSRGLARGLNTPSEYKTMMDAADSPRQGDLDGRGNLSERALIDFIEWFLSTCLDQITFMAGLFDLDNLRDRIARYVDRDPRLQVESGKLLEEALLRGEFDRGEASRITGMPERTARRLLNATIEAGLLASATPKGPVSLRFPQEALEWLFPRLYPAQV